MPVSNIDRIRKSYPRAFAQWTKSEELQLARLVKSGLLSDDIAKQLGRQTSAVNSRIARLGIESGRWKPPDPNFKPRPKPAPPNTPRPIIVTKIARRPAEIIDPRVGGEWIPVYYMPGQRYRFPNEITPYMRQQYRRAALYRWKVSGPNYENENTLYIGESHRLCPDRIDHYLEPEPKSTSDRLNAIFYGLISTGHTIFLDTLRLNGPFIDNICFKEQDLERQDIRRRIEKLIIALYKHHGAKLVNLE